MLGVYPGGSYFGGPPVPGGEGAGGEGALSVTKLADRLAIVGQAITPWTVLASGATSYAASNLPAGLAISGSTGTISGTPTAITGASESREVTITVKGSGGAEVSTSFLYLVEQLAIIAPGPQTIVIGQPVSLQITAPLATSFSATGLPPGLSIDPVTGLISGRATSAGTFAGTVTVKGGGEEASAPLEWSVEAAGFQLCPRALEWLDMLPPILRDSRDYQAALQASAKECERAEDAIELVRAQLKPDQATLLLGVWERITGQTVNPPGRTDQERQDVVLGRLRKMVTIAEGSQWEALVSAILGPGWSYTEHVPGDESTPDEGTLLISLPFESGDARYQEAVSQIREVTPAHLALEFSGLGGFLLDQSHMDLDVLAV